MRTKALFLESYVHHFVCQLRSIDVMSIKKANKVSSIPRSILLYESIVDIDIDTSIKSIVDNIDIDIDIRYYQPCLLINEHLIDWLIWFWGRKSGKWLGKQIKFESFLENSERWSWYWCQVADSSRASYQPPEMHGHWRWRAMYVESLAVRMITTGDRDDWNRWHAGCSRNDTIASDHTGISRRA